MSVSEELQRLNMVEALPRLLSSGNSSCITKMVPKLHEALPGDGAEFHMIASNTFRTILEQNLVPPAIFTQTFLTSIVACIDSPDPYTSKAWLETLMDIIDLLPQNVVKNDVLPVAIARGQLSQSIHCRVTSCEMLGKIATKFDCTQIQKEIVPLVHSLCQDVCGEVRAAMCHQLPYIARGLSPEAVKPALLPLLVELAIDEEQYVRLAAVHTISHLVSVLSGDVLKHTIIPLLKKLCDQAIAAEDRVLCAISEKYGQLCVGLKNVFSETEMSWFIWFFKEMSKLGNGKQSTFQEVKNIAELVSERDHADLLLQCRINCAYNFPGMAQFSGPIIFEDMLHSTFTALSCDHSFHVRRIIAAGIHEVFGVLGAKCLILKSELVMLLSDESRDVLQSLVPNLSALLDQLTKNNVISPSITDAMTFELMRSLIKCEASLSVSNDWRLHSAMLGQLETYVKALPSDLVFSHLPVILFHRIQNSRALPCRLAAARTLLIVLRYTSKVENQNEIRNRIFTELCIHHSCHTRLLFVKMCGMALDIFSSYYIKEHFFLRLLSLASDPVPNVRLVLCGLLPRLRALLKLPHDSNLLSALQEAFGRLESAHCLDKDVLDRLKSARKEIDNKMFSESDDVEDLARYEEEQQIEMRSSVSEPRRLVTVNMKTLGEGKRATLVSLRGPDVSRTQLRQASQLSSGNDANISSNVAVSSVGFLGGHVGNESRITASISSTTSDSAHSYNAITSGKKEPTFSYSSITQVKNDSTPSCKALSLIKKESSLGYSSLTQIKKEMTPSGSKSMADGTSSSSTSSSSLLSNSYPALLEEEFYIDAGVPLPEKLTVSKNNSSSMISSDTVSKIPSLRELLFQNSTLLAQVANRAAATDSAAKSLSHIKSSSSTKFMEQSSGNSSLNSGASKRFSRLLEENTSSDFRYSSLIGRPSPSTVLRKDTLGSSLLPKPTSVKTFHAGNNDSASGQVRDTHPSNAKVLSSGSPRMNSTRNESKIGTVNRRSLVFYSNPGNDSEGTSEKDKNAAGTIKNGNSDNSFSSEQQFSLPENFELSGSKIGNGIVNKYPNRLSSSSPAQGGRTGHVRNPVGASKIASMKASPQEPQNRRHSTLDAPNSLSKDKDHLRNNVGLTTGKRYSLGDKNQLANGSVDKKVSLSSIGVKGTRRSYNPGPRPHSCFIMSQPTDKTNNGNSRSMSQEFLGMDHSKIGSKILKRTPVGFSRSENRQSRIPRGGNSCHSSPTHSRSSSPVHGNSAYITVSHTAPCSARVSRSSSPTEGLSTRVSLASIKLHEPSKLPIRKYNHHL